MTEAVALLTHDADATARLRSRARRRLDVLADRLGVSVETLQGYQRAHGGVPESDAAAVALAAARAAGASEGADVEPGTVLRRPSPKADAPWVKRDKPRYFIAG